MKLPYEKHGRKGQLVAKQHLFPIAVVAAMRLREDTNAVTEGAGDENAATYKGAYLILSNRHDAPLDALTVYGKHWRIEVSFGQPNKNLVLNIAIRRPKLSSLPIWKWSSQPKHYSPMRYGR